MSEIPIGEAETLEDLTCEIDKRYINRKGRKKLKDESGRESDVACDVIICEDRRFILIWPGVAASSLVSVKFDYLERGAKTGKTWEEVKQYIKDFCEKNKILPPIEFKNVISLNKYLMGTCEKYKKFLNLFIRFYLRRKGKDEKVRCSFIITKEPKEIFVWPIRETNNLIVIKYEPTSLRYWEQIGKKIDQLCAEYQIERSNYITFSPK